MKNRVLAPVVVLSLLMSWLIWTVSPPYVKQGGPLIVLGLALFFLALTFAAERLFALARAGGRGDAGSFVQAVKAAILAGRPAEASEACRRQGGCLANVIGAGLERYCDRKPLAAGRKDLIDETRRAFIEAGALESPHLERNLTALSTIASIATLVGLLGTTIGMIRSFQAMSHAGAPDAAQLALGISEALVNTALGLVTAILATVLYNYFTTRADQIITMIEETSYEVLRLLESAQDG